MVPGYTANTFTAGEQPTTTVWNELWNNDAAFNTALTAGGVTYASLLSTIFSGQLQEVTNSGSAGGTFYYVNIGGIKIAWITGNFTIGANNTSTNVFTFPTGFFSTSPWGLSTPINGNGVPLNWWWASAPNTTNASMVVQNPNGSTLSVYPMVLFIGT